jgi:HAD superfamily hydrolase (TIGR01459 family)
MQNRVEQIKSISDIIDRFNYFIIDLWGVLHDGTSPYPGSLECLKKLRDSGKEVILLSNAPRRSFKAAEVLEKLGFKESLYDRLITSGELTYNYASKVITPGSKYIYIGPEKDRDLFDDTELEEVSKGAEADFAVATGFEGFGSVFEEKEDQLKDALDNDLTLICANPDRRVVKQSGEVQICAGLMGEYYKKNGGDVIFFGKPYPSAYDECLKIFDCEDISEVLCIGDSFHTDIEGGNKAGCKTLLCASGIYKNELTGEDGEIEVSNISRIVENKTQIPNFIIDEFKW